MKTAQALEAREPDWVFPTGPVTVKAECLVAVVTLTVLTMPFSNPPPGLRRMWDQQGSPGQTIA